MLLVMVDDDEHDGGYDCIIVMVMLTMMATRTMIMLTSMVVMVMMVEMRMNTTMMLMMTVMMAIDSAGIDKYDSADRMHACAAGLACFWCFRKALAEWLPDCHCQSASMTSAFPGDAELSLAEWCRIL